MPAFSVLLQPLSTLKSLLSPNTRYVHSETVHYCLLIRVTKKDPASTGAAATNKAIVLTLAQQIASIGGNPLDALKSGTFAPGTIGDPTAAGNTCDNIVDEGCINAGKE